MKLKLNYKKIEKNLTKKKEQKMIQSKFSTYDDDNHKQCMSTVYSKSGHDYTGTLVLKRLIFEMLFIVIFFNLRALPEKPAERKWPKKYFFQKKTNFFAMSDLGFVARSDTTSRLQQELLSTARKLLLNSQHNSFYRCMGCIVL